MSTPTTLFSVKIASPRDVAMESIMTCDVIRAWNAAHALKEGRVLLPLSDYVVNTELCDALVAFLHPESGATVDTLEKEIESYLATGHPVFIYSSQARIGFEALHSAPNGADRYSDRAIVDAFKDEKEFRSKFAQHLQCVVETHPRFRLSDQAVLLPNVVEAAVPPEPMAIQPEAPAEVAVPGLSPCATELMIAACQDPEAYIGRLKDGSTLKLQVNGKQMVPQGNPTVIAEWESGFSQLLDGGYIRDAGCHGRLFQVSSMGFEFLASIGHKPVGYIAELGSV